MGAVALVAVVVGSALFGIPCALVVLLRPTGALWGAGLSVAVGLGYGLLALWTYVALRRLGVILDEGDDHNGDGWGRQAPQPSGPEPPSDGLPLWPDMERELREFLEQHDRVPVAG